MQKRTFQGDHATDLGLWVLRLSPLVFSPWRGPWYKCLCLCTELVKLMVLFCFIMSVFFKLAPFGHWPMVNNQADKPGQQQSTTSLCDD